MFKRLMNRLGYIEKKDVIDLCTMGVEATGASNPYYAGVCNGMIWVRTCVSQNEATFVEYKKEEKKS